jgi:hypothetical protein
MSSDLMGRNCFVPRYHKLKLHPVFFMETRHAQKEIAHRRMGACVCCICRSDRLARQSTDCGLSLNLNVSFIVCVAASFPVRRGWKFIFAAHALSFLPIDDAEDRVRELLIMRWCLSLLFP